MVYMGSKACIANELLPIIHSYAIVNSLDNYIEPFVGGANIIDKVNIKNRYAYDKNRFLISLFKYLQNGGELPEDITREQYNDCRAHYQIDDGYYEDWYLAAVGFLAGFSGRFYDGGYAKDTGDRHYYFERKNNLLDQMRSLYNVVFETKSYEQINPHNSIIYCDPPYAGTKGYETITKEFNHKAFWEKMREWSKDNIVLISEESAPDDFDIIWEKDVQRTISTTATRDEYKVTTEKLFIHKSLNDKTDSDDF